MSAIGSWRIATIILTFALIVFATFAPGKSDAHDIEAATAEILLTESDLTLSVTLNLESVLAGIDMSIFRNTNDAPQYADYDSLREFSSEELAERTRAEWPALAPYLVLWAGDIVLEPVLAGVTVPPVGDLTEARHSTLLITATLPAGTEAVTVGWAGWLGPLYLRQTGVARGYDGLLEEGTISAPIPIEGEVARSAMGNFLYYIRIGFDHILPKGLDHILFVLGLFFLSLSFRALIWQVSAFTLAHTVSLALGILGYVSIPAHIVEPLIAASIVYVGVENILSRGLTPWRPVVVFLFGLLHGLGFASVLGDFGMSQGQFVGSLIGFNIGVEFGQLTVIAVAFLTVGVWFGKKPWYRTRIANPASAIIALIGAYWVIERTLL